MSLSTVYPCSYMPVTITGTHLVHVVNGHGTHIFKTTHRNIFDAIGSKFGFIDKMNPGRTAPEFREVDNLLYIEAHKKHFANELYMSGDMILISEDTCVVEALDALELIGKHSGLYYPSDGYFTRVKEVRVPIHALEFQMLIDEENDRWNTTEILTTDEIAIRNHLLFERVIEMVRNYRSTDKEDNTNGKS